MGDNEKILQAQQILTEFIGDLCISTGSILLFSSSGFSDKIPESQSKADTLRHFRKIAFSHIIITLYKWVEFYDKFASVIPQNVREECKKLKKEIERRKIPDFRNQVVGHIWSKKLNRLLNTAEIEKIISGITGNNDNAFLGWINNPQDNAFPKTVVSVVERTLKDISS